MPVWDHHTAKVNGIRLHYVVQGQGPLVVLLHGWPETWYQWRLIMPALAKRFTAVAPDLRGYGLSDKPSGPYDKRTMASDIRALVHSLGHERLRLVGQDRGARVAHRYALDHPEEVEKLVIMDIVPARVVFERLTAKTAQRYWHWFFHLVPDLPERLVESGVETYLQHFFQAWSHNHAAFPPEVVAEYVRAYTAPDAVRGFLSDYRAGFNDDWPLDARDAGRKLEIPTLVLWGAEGLARVFNVLEIWREFASDLRGEAIPACGHFLQEEQPDLVVGKLLQFL
jgi:pimeloyl-ACP methyl ester carboxylesterase